MFISSLGLLVNSVFEDDVIELMEFLFVYIVKIIV